MPNTLNYYYKKLEIDVLLNKLVEFAVTVNGKNELTDIEMLSDIEDIRLELAKVDEALKIIIKLERAPIYNSLDIFSIVSDSLKDKTLSPLEIYEMVRLNSSIRGNKKLLEALSKIDISCPYYTNYVSYLSLMNELDTKIRKAIDNDGYILDDASPNLKRIRTKLNNIDSHIKDKIQQIIQKSKHYLADSLVVIRDDRYCLMVKAEFKNTFNGILHDMSQTMQTCFMEPYEVNQLSNEKDSLKHEEKMEEELILKDLTRLIAIHSEEIINNYRAIVNIDEIFAKGMLAKSYDGECPKVNNDGILDLKNARHPLLKVKKVIPNNISFGKDYLGVIITGPNTGGKTVLLKTVGLLSIMVKYGLLIPASSESNVMIYDQVFCDIGDDQSIENNLSTFSSHMKKMVDITNNVTSNSLALFDEIGAGTDPIEGSAIAEGILDYFIENNISFIVTTHYAELKAYAYRNDKVINASMAFDQDSHKPTYNLIMGQSGASNALNIAYGLGLNKNIIKSAKKYIKEDKTNEVISKVEILSSILHEKEIELNEKLADTFEKEKELDKKLNDIDKTKTKILNDATSEANDIIDSARKEALELLEEIKESKNNNLKLNEEISLKTKINELENKKKDKKTKPIKKENRKPIVGDRVYVSSYEQFGNVVRINRNNTYEVEIGNIHINVDESMLEITKEEVVKEHNIKLDVDMSKTRINLSLDLRGCRVDEAKDKLDKYIDDLIVLRISQATIIHGYGTGAVREMVQSYLSKCKDVASFRYGGAGEGGLGVTVITLK